MNKPTKGIKITIGLACGIVAIIVLVLIIKYFRNFKSISEFPRNAQNQFKISHKLLPFSQPKKRNELHA